MPQQVKEGFTGSSETDNSSLSFQKAIFGALNDVKAYSTPWCTPRIANWTLSGVPQG